MRLSSALVELLNRHNRWFRRKLCPPERATKGRGDGENPRKTRVCSPACRRGAALEGKRCGHDNEKGNDRGAAGPGRRPQAAVPAPLAVRVRGEGRTGSHRPLTPTPAGSEPQQGRALLAPPSASAPHSGIPLPHRPHPSSPEIRSPVGCLRLGCVWMCCAGGPSHTTSTGPGCSGSLLPVRPQDDAHLPLLEASQLGPEARDKHICHSKLADK